MLIKRLHRFKRRRSVSRHKVEPKKLNQLIKFTCVMMGLFITGVCIGASIVNISTYEKCAFVVNPVLNGNSVRASKLSIFMTSFGILIKPVLFIWIIGLTHFAPYGIVTALTYKGAIVGFFIGAAVRCLGVRLGLIFSAASILPQNLIYLPVLFMVSVWAYKNSVFFGKRFIHMPFLYVRQLVIVSICCMAAACADTLITSFFIALVKNFI